MYTIMPSECPSDLNKCEEPEKSSKEKFLRHFISGAVAGVVSRTLTAPIDRIKIFCQVSKSQQHMLTVVSYMIREGGIKSLWRGNLINVLKTTPKSSIRFAFYDFLKINLKDREKELVLKERILAGSIAGLISQTLCFPLEVLKTRMALSTTGQYNGILDAIVQIYKHEGLRSFSNIDLGPVSIEAELSGEVSRGYIPTLIAIIPHSGLDLAGYETLKGVAADFKKDKPLNHFELFVLSSISCMIGQVVTYPLALVCTRMQASGIISPGEKLSTRKMFKDIINYEGFRGLYRGLVPNMIKFIPVVGITFVTYEYINSKLGVSMTR